MNFSTIQMLRIERKLARRCHDEDIVAEAGVMPAAGAS